MWYQNAAMIGALGRLAAAVWLAGIVPEVWPFPVRCGQRVPPRQRAGTVGMPYNCRITPAYGNRQFDSSSQRISQSISGDFTPAFRSV